MFTEGRESRGSRLFYLHSFCCLIPNVNCYIVIESLLKTLIRLQGYKNGYVKSVKSANTKYIHPSGLIGKQHNRFSIVLLFILIVRDFACKVGYMGVLWRYIFGSVLGYMGYISAGLLGYMKIWLWLI